MKNKTIILTEQRDPAINRERKEIIQEIITKWLKKQLHQSYKHIPL